MRHQLRPLAALVLGGSLSIGGCGAPPESSDLTTTTRDFEGEQGMEPGRGFGGVFEEARGLCVDHSGVSTAGSGQEIVFQLQMIENHQDLAAKLNISSASQVKAAVPDTPATVSAKTKFALNSSLTINKYSVYALVSSVVKNETSHLRDVRVKDQALALLEADPAAGIDRFRVQCGDEYIGAYTTGGEFYGVVEIRTQSREEQLEVSHELASKVGIEQIGAVGSNSAIGVALSQVTRDRAFKIWTFQRGGVGETANAVATVDDMINRARQMPAIVQNPTHARILTGTFFDYLTLPINLPASYQPALLKARRTIQQLGRLQATMLDSKANIDYITMHPEQFNGVNGQLLGDLTAARAEIDRRMERIYNVAQACYTDFTQCDVPQDIKTPEFSEPERIRPRIEPQKIAFQIQPTFLDKRKLSDWFSQGECYIRIDVAAEGKNAVIIGRSETYDNCEIPALNIEIDKDRVESAFRSMGVDPSAGWYSVSLYEADTMDSDDFHGNTAVWHSSVIQSGTVRSQIANDKAVINVNVMAR